MGPAQNQLTVTASAMPQTKSEPTKTQRIFTVLFLILSVFVFSAGTIQGLINYAAWGLVGENEFIPFHQAVTARTFTYFVPLAMLSVPVGILMIWLRHPAISRNLVILAAIVNVLVTIVTVTLAIPIHQQLDHGKLPGLLDELIYIHIYFRTLPGLIGFATIVVMLYQLTRPASPSTQ